ncbi:MAG: ABC transporter permease, partial [Chloroflexi bacterium]|nr:ABC transporter permease [Chloroflexota bacterium]
MSPLDTFRTALSAIFGNRLRAGLTLLGVVIGVTAVIALMTIGRGVQQSITSRIASQGTNQLFVQPGVTNTGNASTLTLEDAYSLVDIVFSPSVKGVAPEIRTGAQVVAGRENTSTQVIGVTPEYENIRNLTVEFG